MTVGGLSVTGVAVLAGEVVGEVGGETVDGGVNTGLFRATRVRT